MNPTESTSVNLNSIQIKMIVDSLESVRLINLNNTGLFSADLFRLEAYLRALGEKRFGWEVRS